MFDTKPIMLVDRHHEASTTSTYHGFRNYTIINYMNKNKQKTKTIYRDSDKGRIVTKEYAEKHPKTTEKERVRIG